MSAIEETLGKLEAARGDIREQAVITADFAVALQPAAERDRFRAALDAAAVLRWFDCELLAWMLQSNEEGAQTQTAALARLPFIERFPAASGEAWNVHETTRLGWRQRLASEQLPHFRALSGRAAAHFEKDLAPSGRIEWIYHFLCADPDAAANALERLDNDWAGSAHPEDRQSLALTLGELTATGVVSGRARLEVMLSQAESQFYRAATSHFEEKVDEAFALAETIGYEPALARVYSLRGDLAGTRGNLPAARAANEQLLDVCRRLVAREPENANRRRDLAVSLGKLGDVLLAQDENEAALAAFRESLALEEELARSAPKNYLWQVDLSVAHGRLASAFEAQPALEAAEKELRKMHDILTALVAADPGNCGFLREQAVAGARLGDVLQGQEKLTEAHAAFDENLELCERIAKSDPMNNLWQRDLAVAHNRMGNIFFAERAFEKARKSFTELLAIARRLADADPSNAVAQRELAVAQSQLGTVLRELGEFAAADVAFAESLAISRRLVTADSSNALWQRDLVDNLFREARLAAGGGKKEEQLTNLREARKILQTLSADAPDNGKYRADLKFAEDEIAAAEDRSEANGAAPP